MMMKKLTRKTLAKAACAPSRRLTATLYLLTLLGLSGLGASVAWAAPCCQDCDGWPDPPLPPLDWCWRHCVICFADGSETSRQATAPVCVEEEAVQVQSADAAARTEAVDAAPAPAQ